MNKVWQIGNLTRDPELTETAAGVQICRFTIAVNRNYYVNGEKKTDFFNCVAWRALAETIARYCKKGHKVGVTGSLEKRTYEDNNGVKHNDVDIIVQEVDFLTPKEDSGFYADEPHSDEKPSLQPIDEEDPDCPF